MRRIQIAVLFAGCIIFSADAFAQNDAAASLLAGLAQTKTVAADFTQTKNMALFNAPLVIKGRLYLQRPGYFAWHTDSPMAYSLVMRGDKAWQWDEETKKVQALPLKRSPAFETAVRQMRGWFDGDYGVLAADYDIAVVREQPAVLKFTPKAGSSAAGLISGVKVFFRKDRRYIERIEIKEKNSDTTTIVFTHTVIDAPISPDAWEAAGGEK